MKTAIETCRRRYTGVFRDVEQGFKSLHLRQKRACCKKQICDRPLTNRHFPPALRAEPENMAKLYHSAALYGIIYMKEGVHSE